jgi:hypothetical protein
VTQAPDLGALRNVIGDLFEAVRLFRSDDGAAGVSQRMGGGFIPWHHDDMPGFDADDQGYWLLLELRASMVDAETLRPTGQAIPVPSWQSYPPGFLARYCWW